ncbi:MAG: PEGA domain-containing protein [Desulfuromonadales bacterium]|nr:PEGA domain-containing protein [Desulfuromonadales bacterium]
MMRKFSALLLIVFLTSACAPRQAAFLSEPAGAKVLVDGVAIGETPCRFDYRLSPGDSHTVTLDKDGFDSIEFVVQTDEVDTAARNRWLTAGLVWSPLWLGTLFTKKLKDSYDFMLREAAPALTARTGSETDSDSAL